MRLSFAIFFILCLFLTSNLVESKAQASTKEGEKQKSSRKEMKPSFSPRNFGGECSYVTYKGKAVIVSIKKITDYPQPLPYEPYEVKFSVCPLETIKESFVALEGKRWDMRLKNSYPLGLKFLDKYGIREGACFDCNIKIIKRGTCTPVLFEFPTIDLWDREWSKK